MANKLPDDGSMVYIVLRTSGTLPTVQFRSVRKVNGMCDVQPDWNFFLMGSGTWKGITLASRPSTISGRPLRVFGGGEVCLSGTSKGSGSMGGPDIYFD